VQIQTRFGQSATVRAYVTAVVAAACLSPYPATRAQDSQATKDDLTELNIEDLMKVQVTSVSRREQPLSETAAAVFVISQDDIRHSGALNIPDLLRMVPGVYVARINASTWAICVRGFNGRFSNELLVMVDGRTIYTPTFGGVFWDVLDLPLIDIERIEVIRGPGGSIWGANAVNGVINIITKKATETQGTTIVAGAGNQEPGFGTLEYGGSEGKSLAYRVFARYVNENQMQGNAGLPGADGWYILAGGFRVDSEVSSKDSLSVQGNLYSGRERFPAVALPSITSPALVPADSEVNLSGGFLQGTWDHRSSETSDTTLTVSYQRYERSDALDETRGTLDLDFQDSISLGSRQQILWGLEFRHTSSAAAGSLVISLNPSDTHNNLYSGFFQYQVALADDRLHFTFGTKLIDHYYTGFAAMPTARVAWTPSSKHTLWAAYSGAVRTPADTDVHERINVGGFPGPGGVPVLISIFGNPNLQNEKLRAYEAGYRAVLHKNLSVDIALYYNHFEDQLTIEPMAPFFEDSPAPPHIVLPSTNQNLMRGEAHGLEVYANWKLSDRWTLSPGYAFEAIHQHIVPPSTDTAAATANGEGTPVHSAQLRSHVVLPFEFSWDTSAYFTGALLSPQVPSYTRLDTGLTWRRKNLTISAFGQNLAQSRHLEFIDSTGGTTSTFVPRSAYARIVWHF
jgi:iron complex outermembrane receptor protein